MTASLPTRAPALLAVVALLCSSGTARGQMTPLQDLRTCSVDHVTFMGVTDSHTEDPPAPFAPFFSAFQVTVENPDPDGGGSCSASAFQNSQFYPGGIQMDGGTGGSWNIHPGDYSAVSYARFDFRVDTCIEYQFDAWLEPGDLGTESTVRVAVPNVNLAYQAVTTAEVHETGRLPAGEYYIEGNSYIISSAETTAGPVFAIQWTCRPCVTTLIWAPPQDQNVGCGGTAVFTVQTSVPPGTLTYQWRRNLVPLASGGNVSGVNTPALTISNACLADAGYYDVVLSDGTIIEPSGLAELTVETTISGAESAEGPRPAFSLAPAGPNPFSGHTAFRYAAAAPQRATIAIYNASGARVRTLVAGVLSGSGTVRWDGRLEGGAQAPAGIYFLRVEAGAIRESRKIVLVR